jgi:ubiquinone/menaquinone biosynthesis C-methylase UbiE
MRMMQTFKSFVRGIVKHQPSSIKKDAPEAYDLWSSSYDNQPDNLMLALDDRLFSTLLETMDVRDKMIADIGCGTGRHWDKILSKNPGKLTGYDVSQGMLDKLLAKYPQSEVKKIYNNLYLDKPGQSFDIIISTLTIAHITDIDEAIRIWCRLLKPSADIIITDFHPEALALGGSRTFMHGYRKISINNHVHRLETLQSKFEEQGFVMIREEHRRIDDTLKHYYEKHGALDVFKKFRGVPMIYGMHLRRSNATT